MLLTYCLSNSIFSKYKSINIITDISNYNKFLTTLDQKYTIELTLWETERNSVYYNGK